MKIGFARISTNHQSNQAQVERLNDAGCEKIFEERASGGLDIDKRTKLQECLSHLREGDILCCTKLDRIARSTTQLLKIAEYVNKVGAELQFLDSPIDTTTPAGKLVFEILGAIASFERELIVARTKEGLEHARNQGKVIGRPKRTNEEIDRKIKARWKSGESWKSIGEDYGISRQAVYRRIKKWRQEEATEEVEKEIFGE